MKMLAAHRNRDGPHCCGVYESPLKPIYQGSSLSSSRQASSTHQSYCKVKLPLALCNLHPINRAQLVWEFSKWCITEKTLSPWKNSCAIHEKHGLFLYNACLFWAGPAFPLSCYVINQDGHPKVTESKGTWRHYNRDKINKNHKQN